MQSKLPYGALDLFVNKKDNKLKMCINYCASNKVTIKNTYPLPCIDNLLNWFNGINYFSRIDVKSRYYEIHIAPENVEKIAVRISYGSYEFLILLFKICNTLSIFTTLMNSIFHEKLDEFMIIYIDNILPKEMDSFEHVLTREKVRPHLKKLQAIKDW